MTFTGAVGKVLDWSGAVSYASAWLEGEIENAEDREVRRHLEERAKWLDELSAFMVRQFPAIVRIKEGESE